MSPGVALKTNSLRTLWAVNNYSLAYIKRNRMGLELPKEPHSQNIWPFGISLGNPHYQNWLLFDLTLGLLDEQSLSLGHFSLKKKKNRSSCLTSQSLQGASIDGTNRQQAKKLKNLGNEMSMGIFEKVWCIPGDLDCHKYVHVWAHTQERTEKT